MTVHPRALDYLQSFLSGVIPDEAELTAGQRVEPGRSYGFFTDTTLCIGCKACEVACKEWNALPADDLGLRGTSYDNTGDLSAATGRHVHFIEHIAENGERATEMPPFQSNWLMMSDVCKHCSPAPCLEACPTGALFRRVRTLSSFSRTSAMAAAIASRLVRLASSMSVWRTARRINARCATTA
jgi:formate dehydrogenase iron-sulfur subunit